MYLKKVVLRGVFTKFILWVLSNFLKYGLKLIYILNIGRQEIDKRVQEKCDEYEMMKKNQQRLIESLQASLEAESRSKAEVIRTKKKLETDIQELENALDHASQVSNYERWRRF